MEAQMSEKKKVKITVSKEKKVDKKMMQDAGEAIDAIKSIVLGNVYALNPDLWIRAAIASLQGGRSGMEAAFNADVLVTETKKRIDACSGNGEGNESADSEDDEEEDSEEGDEEADAGDEDDDEDDDDSDSESADEDDDGEDSEDSEEGDEEEDEDEDAEDEAPAKAQAKPEPEVGKCDKTDASASVRRPPPRQAPRKD
jgi:cobalamin biosynthesis protein CobT